MEIINLGGGPDDTEVRCDYCSKNFTFESQSGGYIFGSNAVCPICAVEGMRKVRKYKEEHYIRAVCPEGESFWNFVMNYRKKMSFQKTPGVNFWRISDLMEERSNDLPNLTVK